MVGIEKIIKQILSAAQAKADTIIGDAKARCAQIEADLEAKKQEIDVSLEDEAVKEGESTKMRARSAIAKHKRDSVLSIRATLLDRAFEEARLALINLGTEEYRELFSALLAKTICERVQSEEDSMRLYGEDISCTQYQLIMNKKDKDAHGKAIIEQARRAVVGKLSPEVLDRLVLADKSANISGGFIIKCGNVELNCSVDSIISEIRPRLEAEVAEVLFDGQGNGNNQN